MNSIQFLYKSIISMLSSCVPHYIINLPTTKSNPKFQQRIPGEYKMKHATAYHSFGPFPGSAQTAVPLPELCYMDIPNDPNEHVYADVGGKHYALTEHTAENKLRSFPATISEEDMRKQHLILCMEYKDPNSNEIWLKSAYLNHDAQTVSLYTSTNRKDNLKRPVATHAQDGWFIGKYPMAAPLAFWRELKNRLVN